MAAVAERINGILKQEFNLEEYDVKLPIMRAPVKDSIKVYYGKRYFLCCQMKTPEQMYKQNSIKSKRLKNKTD